MPALSATVVTASLIAIPLGASAEDSALIRGVLVFAGGIVSAFVTYLVAMRRADVRLVPQLLERMGQLEQEVTKLNDRLDAVQRQLTEEQASGARKDVEITQLRRDRRTLMAEVRRLRTQLGQSVDDLAQYEDPGR